MAQACLWYFTSGKSYLGGASLQHTQNMVLPSCRIISSIRSSSLLAKASNLYIMDMGVKAQQVTPNPISQKHLLQPRMLTFNYNCRLLKKQNAAVKMSGLQTGTPSSCNRQGLSSVKKNISQGVGTGLLANNLTGRTD